MAQPASRKPPAGLVWFPILRRHYGCYTVPRRGALRPARGFRPLLPAPVGEGLPRVWPAGFRQPVLWPGRRDPPVLCEIRRGQACALQGRTGEGGGAFKAVRARLPGPGPPGFAAPAVGGPCGGRLRAAVPLDGGHLHGEAVPQPGAFPGAPPGHKAGDLPGGARLPQPCGEAGVCVRGLLRRLRAL